MMAHIATDPMHQFKIVRLFDLNIGGVDVSFTNSSLFMVIGVLGIIVFFAWALSRPKTVPDRKQSLAEIWYGFVAGIVRDVNHEDGKPFVPLVFTIFSFIFVANVLGMFSVPGANTFTSTSHIVVTGTMAVFTFLLVVAIGIWKNGFKFLKVFVPSGVPWYILWFVVIIEVFSFLSRPLSLGMRLFANMLGGHVALKVFAGFIPQLVIGLGLVGVGMAAFLVMPLVIGVTALELLVAFLQAYVFAILTCVYLNDSLHPGH
ncbi:MAG TPA: F0F1 ATP synthase subunit A [Hyphomonadaceae bacterium]|nr:F0F1 ATP synthase subunit A [Hyphomonadaceae bacterium]